MLCACTFFNNINDDISYLGSYQAGFYHFHKHKQRTGVLLAEFMASGGVSTSQGSSSLARKAHKPSLIKLSSSDKYVLDYGAKFRDLMDDAETSTDVKCLRIYA
jgi:hypothetical protein